MPKVHYVKANKDNACVKKGEMYYHWGFFRGPKLMSKTPPRQSQLTQQEALSQAHSVYETLSDTLSQKSLSAAHITSACDDAAEAMDEAIELVSETINNLEDAFQGGCPALEEKQEQLDNFESFKSECEDAANEIEALDNFEDEEKLNDDSKQELIEAALEIAQALSPSY